MLNVGVIGNMKVLEPYVKRIRKNKVINVIGKTSVGTNTEMNGFHFSIPEFNRVELIERSDILLIDNSPSMLFDILCDILKKSKHIFIAEYLDITSAQFAELVKLSAESDSVVQVTNPVYCTPAIQWLNKNKTKPIFLDISKHTHESTLKEILFPLLLLLAEITGINPKRVVATAFTSNNNEVSFANIRLDYGDASVVNINFGDKLSSNKFKIDTYSKKQIATFDFKEDIFLLNNSPIIFSDNYTINEFDIFIGSIQNQSQKSNSLEEYYSAIKLVEFIEKKISQFTV